MEFVLGALGASGAVCFTNPLEVVKTRFQLQGELKKAGNYKVHYRNFPHAVYVVAKHEGLLALQKGLFPAMGHQVGFMENIFKTQMQYCFFYCVKLYYLNSSFENILRVQWTRKIFL